MSKGPRFEAPVEHHIRRGDDAGGALRSASYTANSLNQYTSRDVPAYLNVLGIANANASVTVNSQSAYRKGEYFWKELAPNNASAAVWQAVTNIASLTGTNQTNTGNLFLPKTAEAYTYDLDGNLTSDGRWTNKWDAENRLIDMTSHSSGPSGSRKSLQFAYDSQGRRYSKVVSNWTGSAWTRVLHEKFLYDGWNLLGAFNGTNAAIIRSFLWGLDLSGSMQGAGGVGGLIAFRQHSGSLAGSHFAAYDGNGNVMALVDGRTGSTSARYEYDPFGQTIRASGAMATANPVRFSSKVVDDETDYAYYGYRYLNPNSGRWLSRDPIGEKGGLNIASFVGNSALTRIDRLGDTPVGLPLGANLVDVRFYSQGYAYRDPFYFSLWSEEESGEQSSLSSSYSQSVRSIYNPGGLCNSGDPLCSYFFDTPIESKGTSYLKAWAKNKGSCCVRLRFTCTIIASARASLAANTTLTAATMAGNLLGDTVPESAHSQSAGLISIFGWNLYNSQVDVKHTVSKELNCPPKTIVDVYHLYMSLGIQTVGVPFLTAFSESASASCSTEFAGGCK